MRVGCAPGLHSELASRGCRHADGRDRVEIQEVHWLAAPARGERPERHRRSSAAVRGHREIAWDAQIERERESFPATRKQVKLPLHAVLNGDRDTGNVAVCVGWGGVCVCKRGVGVFVEWRMFLELGTTRRQVGGGRRDAWLCGVSPRR